MIIYIYIYIYISKIYICIKNIITIELLNSDLFYSEYCPIENINHILKYMIINIIHSLYDICYLIY